MVKFFCAESSQEAGEEMVGSAVGYQTYVLIECPTPWAVEAIDSPTIPHHLQEVVTQMRQTHPSWRFLLIAGQPKQHRRVRVLIYQQQSTRFCGGYQRFEVEVDTIEQVADTILMFLSGKLSPPQDQTALKDILICTHGSHDHCCAKYGIPFYRQAIALATELGLANVRIWKASHFGGHRFAPTAITLPDGRYYGRLETESLHSILTQTGDINCFQRVYRGWGILPVELQVLEQELLIKYGWSWLQSSISYQVLSQAIDQSWIDVLLSIQKPEGEILQYRAEIIRDESKTMCLKGSCSATREAIFFKYAVSHVQLLSDRDALLLEKNRIKPNSSSSTHVSRPRISNVAPLR